MNSKAKILIVDDEQFIANRMQGLLQAADYDADVLYSGEEVFEHVKSHPPDLILLDVLLPGINGYEVCRRLKADPATAIIPIIMATSLVDRKHRQEAMAAGAVDYLTKPVDTTDLLLRVANAVRTKSLYDDLQRSYAQLRDVEGLRDNLIHLIVHDMRTPLQAVTGYLQLLDRTADDSQRKLLRMARESSAMLTRLTDDLLAVHQMEHGKLELRRSWTSIGSIWNQARVALEAMATMQEVELISMLTPDGYTLQCDMDLLKRVLINLVGNALKYTPRRGRIEIDAYEWQPGQPAQPPEAQALAELAEQNPQQTWIVVWVRDTGPGIPPQYYQTIFERFGVVDAMQSGTRRSTGLGLAFCKLAIEGHEGRIGVQSESQQGCRFWFALPRF